MKRRRLLIAALALAILAFLLWLAQPGSTDVQGYTAPELSAAPTPPKLTPYTPGPHSRALPEVAPPQPDEPSAPRPLRGSSNTLSNGLTVIIVEDHSNPVIATRIVVKAGSAHDPPGQEGLAHLVEHLMFLGTTGLGTTDWSAEQPWQDELAYLTEIAAQSPQDSRRVSGEIADALAMADESLISSEYSEVLDAIGAKRVNAFTGLDTTEYAATLPANSFLPWAMLEAERFSDPVFRSFPRVQEVVDLERKERANALRSEAYKVLFEGHPYARPTGGSADSIQRLHIPAANSFYDRFYQPENMAIVVVGDIDPAEARRILEEQFGEWRPPALPLPELASVPETRAVLDLPSTPSDRSTLMWSFPPIRPSDEPALQIALSALGTYLHNHDNGWGVVQLGLARNRYGATARISGICHEYLYFSRMDRAHCTEVVRRSIERLNRTGVSGIDFDWLRKRAWYEHIREVEDPDSHAHAIASAWAIGLDLDRQWALIDRLRLVTSEQVEQVIDTYLRPLPFWEIGQPKHGRLPSHRYRLRNASPPRGGSSEVYRWVTGIDRAPLPAHWAQRGLDFDTSEDGRVVVAYNPSNTLFEARFVYPLGWSEFPELAPALRAWKRASDQPGSLFRQLRRYGVRLQVESSGPDETVLLADGPREGIDPLLQLLPTALGNATVVKQSTSRGTRDIDRWARFGASSPWRSSFPSLSEHALRAALAQLSVRSPRVLYSGTETVEGLHRATDFGLTERETPPAFSDPGLRIGLDEEKLYSKAMIRLYAPIPAQGPGSEAQIDLLKRIYGGRTGRARTYLRENSALSYSPQVKIRPPTATGPGWMVLQARTRQNRVEEGAELMLALFSETTVDSREWEKLLGRARDEAWANPFHFRTLPQVIGAAVDRGIDTDPAELRWEELQSVEQGDLDALLDEIAAGPKALYIRAKKLEASRWSALGTVEML